MVVPRFSNDNAEYKAEIEVAESENLSSNYAVYVRYKRHGIVLIT